MQKLISAAEAKPSGPSTPIRVVVVTMDTHLASAAQRANAALLREIPGLQLSMHAASEYAGNDAAIARCKQDIAQADIVVAGMLFLEDHFLPILDDLRARRDHCDAMICMMSATEVVKLTKLGKFDMDKPASGPMALLKKLRGSKDKASTGGAAQMKMLRRIPQMLRFVPGTAQDVRAYFMTLQYWLGGSDENVFNLIRHVVDRGAAGPRRELRGLVKVPPPVEYPDAGPATWPQTATEWAPLWEWHPCAIGPGGNRPRSSAPAAAPRARAAFDAQPAAPVRPRVSAPHRCGPCER